ncbi:hypothetical protein DFJ58DRAFT_765186 [Suillus subalutaceus]|uniref:uncharacterized protein n=1 Tax=Suillus subalutaceus TaxID=48586 RepID=UPI001B87D16C|nr:uncharacterized protein DFJ58DRAFT_765186 [Suillus subalutaceus]KAG1870216.1 hypothetical protein DFJ58DRAFT_765186 [Suillus subalutaceus]
MKAQVTSRSPVLTFPFRSLPNDGVKNSTDGQDKLVVPLVAVLMLFQSKLSKTQVTSWSPVPHAHFSFPLSANSTDGQDKLAPLVVVLMLSKSLHEASSDRKQGEPHQESQTVGSVLSLCCGLPGRRRSQHGSFMISLKVAKTNQFASRETSILHQILLNRQAQSCSKSLPANFDSHVNSANTAEVQLLVVNRQLSQVLLLAGFLPGIKLLQLGC